jgi:uncharacterized protein DUF4416
MGQIHAPSRVLLIVAASSRYDGALAWARERWRECYGPVALESEPFAFTETDYYTQTMGIDLNKQFFASAQLVDPGILAGVKRRTNEWEIEYADSADHPESRPLNLDPGYITLAKLLLASTKDHAHRIYLGEGIYAEVTLNYRHRAWQRLDWTYPDYNREEYHAFFTRCRQLLR